jgi:hypothetical protein
MNKQIKQDIDKYYKYFSATKIKNKSKKLDNQELYKLYKKPKIDKDDEIPHIYGADKWAIQQADILYMPNDNGYKYMLVVVDVSSGITDAEPLKSKDNKTVLDAFKKIYDRKIVQPVKYIIQTDPGKEFNNQQFKKYFHSLGVMIRYGKPGRSRQQAYAESRNRTVATALFHRMTAQELLTGEKSTEWVEDLPLIISEINKYVKKHKKKIKFSNLLKVAKNQQIYIPGDKVRVMLDKPQEPTGQKLSGKFRATDIRWDPKISTITNLIFEPNQPILYQVNNKPTS